MKSYRLVCITGSAGQKLRDKSHVNSGIQVDLILIVEVQLISMLRYWRRITGAASVSDPGGSCHQVNCSPSLLPLRSPIAVTQLSSEFPKMPVTGMMDLGAGKAITFWWNSMKCFSDGFLISNDSLLAKICFKPSHKLRCMNMNRNKQTSVQPCGFSLP